MIWLAMPLRRCSGTREDVAEDADTAVLYCHDIPDCISINHAQIEAGFERVERPRNALIDVPVHVLPLVDEQVANVFRPARLRFLNQQALHQLPALERDLSQLPYHR